MTTPENLFLWDLPRDESFNEEKLPPEVIRGIDNGEIGMRVDTCKASIDEIDYILPRISSKRLGKLLNDTLFYRVNKQQVKIVNEVMKRLSEHN